MLPIELRRWLAAALFALAAWPAQAANVGWERLLAAGSDAEAGNWLMTNGDLRGQRFSPLATINRDTVGELRLSFSHPAQISFGELFEGNRLSAPLVDGGMLYLADGMGRVVKIDFTEEDPVVAWTAQAAFGGMDAWLAGQWNLALSGDHVLFGAGDGQVHWIDAANGEVSRTARVGDPATGYELAAAPQVLEDRVLLGGSGTERGAVLRMDALGHDGEPLWATLPVAPADNGAPPLPGGSFLRTGAYDPEVGLAYWTTGPALPPLGSLPFSPGMANTLLAFDPASGAVRWSHRFAEDDPPDLHAEAASPLVVPLAVGGAPVPKVLHLGDNGMFYRFDAATGALELSATMLDAMSEGPDCAEVISEPHMPATWSRSTGFAYAAINRARRCGASDDTRFAGETTVTGELVAVDPATGTVAVRRSFDFPLQSGLLATAGGLVFAVTADGTVHALADDTLERLWSFDLPSVRASPPVTFEARGRQYLAVLSGGGPLYSLLPFHPADMRNARHLTVLVVFGLGGD